MPENMNVKTEKLIFYVLLLEVKGFVKGTSYKMKQQSLMFILV